MCKWLSIFTVYNDDQQHIYETRGQGCTGCSRLGWIIHTRILVVVGREGREEGTRSVRVPTVEVW